MGVCVWVGWLCLRLRLRVRVFAYGCLIVNKCEGVYIKTQVCVWMLGSERVCVFNKSVTVCGGVNVNASV